MSESKQAGSGGGILLPGLTIAFVVLKLTHVIKWSWLWVLAPVWIPAAVVVAILLVVGIIVGLFRAFESKQAKRRRLARRDLSRIAGDLGTRRSRPRL